MSSAAPPTPVGTRLRQAREARGLSLLQAAHALHIKPHYLEALERDDWDALPSPAHARGFLRTYAAFLGLNPDALLATSPVAAPGPASVPPTQPAAQRRPNDDLPPEAQAIFRELGQTLRRQRESLGLSLDDAEALTRVKAHYLLALEEGRVDALPSPVQGRGMLLHYARALHLDPEPLLLAFAEGLQARLQARERPQAARWWWRLQVQHWGNLLLAGLAVAAVVLFLLWSTLQVLQVYATQAQTPTVAALGVMLRTPTSAVEATALVTISAPSPPPGTAEAATVAPPEAEAVVVASPAVTPAAETPPPEPVTAPVHVVVQVRHRAWLRVLSDGQEVFRARVAPGERFTFRAEERLEVQTGDAAALELVYNQQDLGVLGRLGEPLVLLFTPEQMLTPTPLASPTPTITPTPTATPTGPTPTPQGSPTPSPTPTPVLRPRP